MSLYFVTGNKGKFAEVKSLLPHVEQLDLDLPEIQSLDPQVVIRSKLLAALQHGPGEYIVEDTSVYMAALNWTLPGPLIKWFLEGLGNEGLGHLAAKMGQGDARVATIFGYAKNETELYFFDGELAGAIVAPRGNNGFGWNPIFQPTGSSLTFGEMTQQEKDSISMRMTALKKLKDFLESK